MVIREVRRPWHSTAYAETRPYCFVAGSKISFEPYVENVPFATPVCPSSSSRSSLPFAPLRERNAARLPPLKTVLLVAYIYIYSEPSRRGKSCVPDVRRIRMRCPRTEERADPRGWLDVVKFILNSDGIFCRPVVKRTFVCVLFTFQWNDAVLPCPRGAFGRNAYCRKNNSERGGK